MCTGMVVDSFLIVSEGRAERVFFFVVVVVSSISGWGATTSMFFFLEQCSLGRRNRET
jgi:hypothetical protein